MSAPPDAVWDALELAYRELRIPVASVDRYAYTIESANLAQMGADPYYRCSVEPSLGPAPMEQLHVSVATSLRRERGQTLLRSRVTASVTGVARDGRIVRRNCPSTGVLEARILRTVEARV